MSDSNIWLNYTFLLLSYLGVFELNCLLDGLLEKRMIRFKFACFVGSMVLTASILSAYFSSFHDDFRFQRSLYRTIRDEVVSREFDVKLFLDLYCPLDKVKQMVFKASESALSLVNLQPKQRKYWQYFIQCSKINPTSVFPGGYAFAQDEGGAVSQSELVRMYDSSKPKIAGSPLEGISPHT